jgi:hypothetical protein
LQWLIDGKPYAKGPQHSGCPGPANTGCNSPTQVAKLLDEVQIEVRGAGVKAAGAPAWTIVAPNTIDNHLARSSAVST